MFWRIELLANLPIDPLSCSLITKHPHPITCRALITINSFSAIIDHKKAVHFKTVQKQIENPKNNLKRSAFLFARPAVFF